MMRTNFSFFLAKIATVICFALVMQDAFALCSNDRHPSINNEMKSSAKVLVAKVVSSQDQSSSDDPEGIEKTIYQLRIVKTFKGSVSRVLSVTSENTSGRFLMDVGKSYLLFIKSYGALNIVDSCGNSGLLEDRKKEIDVIKNNSSHPS